MDGESVVAAFAQFEAARAALAALPVESLTAQQVLAITEMRERGRRRDLTIDHALTTHLIDTATPDEPGATSLTELLANRLHITAKDAGQRLTDATQLGPRHTLLGERVATELAHTAATVARGDIGIDHVRVIQEFIKKVPSFVDVAARDEFERLLAKSAITMRPEQLRQFAAELMTYLDQDGTEPDYDTQQRRREIHVGPQQADGMSRISGWIDPEFRALLDVALAKLAAPGANLTHDDAHTGRDDRTAAQRNHDAVKTVLRDTVASGNLGQVAGVPATIVATTTVNELERAAGWAHTGGGNRIPIRDLIRMAASSRHYLAVFDDHTEEVLYFGRARRNATTAQRLALFARDKGCTHPRCTVPFYWTEAHHTPDFSTGGRTDIPDLTLACQPANLLIEKTGWTTERPGNGRTHWIPPREFDTGQPRVNNHFHPQRYLTDGEREDDDDPE
ncbi:hypothetical protein NIIDNTM18_20610 [Mycolicibacterium litorale]|uniref:DUF222 domain-containing protein n=1 Tax=Mycolicibacterium litorale TaxID=758802 RepID=A0A6S6NZ94_9MYCO|nr:HNH endonuclease signature motif containing protein [Mycolicibacterium litorale]BCI52783.1 hypothetical protein NIIDNTM18_20610 [Mycolicibacterium litorale]